MRRSQSSFPTGGGPGTAKRGASSAPSPVNQLSGGAAWSSHRLTPVVLALGLALMLLNMLHSPPRIQQQQQQQQQNPAHAPPQPGAGIPDSPMSGLTAEQRAAAEAILQGLEPGGGGGRLRVATILSEPRKYYCTMLASAALSGVEVEVFGWGDRDLHGVSGWWRKILWFKAILESYDPNDVVMFVDAGDVLFSKGARGIAESYAATVATQGLRREDEFIWSAERNCGMKTLTKAECAALHKIPEGHRTPYRWLNTGGWIGRADVGREIFDAVDKDRGGRTNQADQAFVAESHVRRGWKERHGLDYDQRVFMSVYKSAQAICGFPHPKKPLRNCETHTTPAVFHFNAGAKDARVFDPVLQAMEYWPSLSSKERASAKLNARPVAVNGVNVTLGQLCPAGYGLVEDRDVRSVRAKINLGQAEHPRAKAGG